MSVRCLSGAPVLGVICPDDVDYFVRVDGGAVEGSEVGVASRVQAPQGDWVGFGAGGCLLAGWNGSSDAGHLPVASLTVE